MLLLPGLLVSLLWLLPVVLCAEDFYKLLELDRGATDRQIKKAYRTLSKKYHPDKNPGNESASQKFVLIAEAYDALSEPSTRKIYDQYGHDGLAQHKQSGGQGGGGNDPFDLFSRFFGGSGHFGSSHHQQGQRRGPNMEAHVSIPLRDFYTGAEHEFAIEKQMICEECEGSGSADGVVDTCQQCQGRGAVIQKHQLAPGIFQQVPMQCERCGGQGKQIRHKCKVCGGGKVVKKVESHTLHVERGMPRGERVVYENEADESPDWVAGDLVVGVAEDEPKLSRDGGGGEAEEGARSDGTFFRRKGRDLFWKEVLSLREAWMGGWKRELVHLDGHVVVLGRERGQVVQPGQVEVLEGEGMPVWVAEQEQDKAGEEEYGRLLIEYTVVLPDKLEKPMEKDFWALWEKWRKKIGVDLGEGSGRPVGDGKKGKTEL